MPHPEVGPRALIGGSIPGRSELLFDRSLVELIGGFQGLVVGL